jgi:hypothetical protein
VLWLPFALQTVFAAVAAAVIVNLFPRKKSERLDALAKSARTKIIAESI